MRIMTENIANTELNHPHMGTSTTRSDIADLKKDQVHVSKVLERKPHFEHRESGYELSDLNRNIHEENIPDQIVVDDSSSIQEDVEIGLEINTIRNIWRISAACIWSFLLGYNDGAPGVFLPDMEEQYNISYAVVSLVWLGNAIGFILVACIAHYINIWFKKLKSIPLGCCFMILMYALVLSGTKFPVIVIGFFFGGVGGAITLSHINVFISHLKKSSKVYGFLCAAYGLGATVSPLIATAFIDSGIKWHYFYLTSLGMMCCDLINLFFAFRGVDSELSEIRNDDISSQNDQISQADLLTDVLKNKSTWLTSLWNMFYQGGEVAIGGWFITYLKDYRKNTSDSIGYTISGYWLGLTIGRLVLTRPFHIYIGIRRANIILTIGSIIFIMLTWVIPHLVLEGVFVSIAGIFIGPLYPLMLTLIAKILPRKIQVVSLTITTAFGSSGGALFPFFIGLISQYKGAYIVLPAFIVIYFVMLLLWITLPNYENRTSNNNGQKLNLFKRLW